MRKIFKTDTGVTVPAVTAGQMREVDRIAVEETGPNLFQMMENAGRSLATLALEKLGEDREKASVVVLAGPGGNGGGGICAARHLANRGVEVLICLSDSEGLNEISEFQRKVFSSTPGREITIKELASLRPTLIIDALLGYSLNGSPRGKALELIRWANSTGQSILSLDVPSGLEATTGDAAGEVMKPAWTLTLALPKTGLRIETCGSLSLADIGIPRDVYQKAGFPHQFPFDDRFILPLFIERIKIDL